VLFDVDGTLLLTRDDVYVDVPGDTAPAHTRRALDAAGLAEAEIDAGLERWCDTFAARYVELLAAADTSHWELGPHAREAVAGVEHRALLTGNPAAVAHARMDRLGLADLFPQGQGAFGCDREDRVELFALAPAPETGRPNERWQSATRRSTSRPHMQQAVAASP
jgi:hypothetical protein